MAKAVALFSGSKGNCYYIGAGNEGVLIDCGRSCKQIENAMNMNNLSMQNVGAIFITHEHIDHCSALKVLASRYNIKVYASLGTLQALDKANRLDRRFQTFIIENEIPIGNMNIKRINTPHDASESCCYSVALSDGKVATIATDLGVMTNEVKQSLLKSDFVVLESNHDVEMLKNGAYPFPLKKRILSDYGHLSNDVCAENLVDLVKGGTLRLMLGHLSEQNNTPEIALKTAISVLQNEGLKLDNDYTLAVAPVETNAKSIIF